MIPVYVRDGGGREVVVDNEVDPSEIDPAAHQLCTDEHPDAAHAETAHHVITLMEERRYILYFSLWHLANHHWLLNFMPLVLLHKTLFIYTHLSQPALRFT